MVPGAASAEAAVKILVIPIGSHGDVHPFVGLGVELVRRGHEVTLITSPTFAPLAERVGCRFVPLGTAEQYHRVLANPDVWHPRRGLKLMFTEMVGTLLRSLFALIADLYEPGRTVVVHHPLGLGARLAQEKLGVPTATAHISPASLRSIILPPVMPAVSLPAWSPHWYRRLAFWAGDLLVVDPIVSGPLNSFRAELGLPPVRRILNGWWNSPQRVLGLFPPWFAPPPPDWPPQTRLTGFPLFDECGLREVPAELEAFLQAGAPPVVFTPGSAMMHGRRFFEAAVEACRLVGCRGLLLTSFLEHLPPALPETVRHFGYVPFSQVLPRAAAVVHHGGIGTTAQGLAAGVPQLIMPMGFDQPDNAARLARLGVAPSLAPRRFTGPRLARALQRLLRPEVWAVCREIAPRLDGPAAVRAACDVIETLPAGSASPVQKN
jgi:UDP:flavonoid glycosyltransferase YjiC (YdhE family)